MCILHNLSYRLDAEVPTRYRQLEHHARNAYTEKSSTSCFSNKGDKLMVSGRLGPRPGHLSPPGPETSPRGQASPYPTSCSPRPRRPA